MADEKHDSPLGHLDEEPKEDRTTSSGKRVWPHGTRRGKGQVQELIEE